MTDRHFSSAADRAAAAGPIEHADDAATLPVRADDLEIEIAAIGVCVTALDSLGPSQRPRVMAYLADRYKERDRG